MKPITKAIRAAKKISNGMPWADRCNAVHRWRKALDGIFGK